MICFRCSVLRQILHGFAIPIVVCVASSGWDLCQCLRDNGCCTELCGPCPTEILQAYLFDLFMVVRNASGNVFLIRVGSNSTVRETRSRADICLI